MSTKNLQTLSSPELVDRFTAVEIAQFHAELQGDVDKQNKCVAEAMAIADELKRRSGDQRSALLVLYGHSNIQVRLMAAKLTLAITPAAARNVIQTIADSKKHPQAMDAGMCLWTLEQDTFKPT